MRLRFGLIGLVSLSVLFTVGYVLSEYAGLYAPFSAFGKLKVEGVPSDLALKREKITPASTAERLSPEITLSVRRVDFGRVPIGEGEREFTVKVTNTGNAPLRISEIEVPPGPFALSRSPVLPAVIGPGVRVTFSISLSPVTRGLKAATATILTDAPTARVEIPLEAVIEGTPETVVAVENSEGVSYTSRPLLSGRGKLLPVPPRVVKRSIDLPVCDELSEALQWLAAADSSAPAQVEAGMKGLASDDSYKSEDESVPQAEPMAQAGPQIKIVSPPDGTTVSGTVSLRSELKTEDEISHITLEIDGHRLQAEYKQSGSLLEITFDSRSLTDGPHQVSVEVLGKLGSKTVVALTLWVANSSEGKPQSSSQTARE